MIPVDEAVQRIVARFSPLPPETIPLIEACGRVLASDVIAGFDQPPGDVFQGRDSEYQTYQQGDKCMFIHLVVLSSKLI